MKRIDADTLGHVFGKTFTDALDEPILVIGADRWGRIALADIGVTQLRAARIVSEIAREIKARSTRDLYRRLAPSTLAGHVGAGLHTLFVVWRAFEAKGLNSVEWYWKGREGAIRTFVTLKQREARANTRVRKAMPRRAQIAVDEERRAHA